jgi:tetratricopeptide (TPR) repeat protein
VIVPWSSLAGRCSVACLLGVAVISTPAEAALTQGARLAAIYQNILDARFSRADEELTHACAPAPAEACQALGVVSLWWQILITPESRLLDQRLEDAAAAAIAANEAWTRREPRRAEAWFYLAGSYAPRVQLRVLRGSRLSAALDGRKIKDALERALQLDPGLADAYFGIGLYHYYADIAPAAAKMVRWLLFLPGGDRVKGLHEMLEAQSRGELLRGEAKYQLHLLYLWYEHRPAEALQLIEQLADRYPNNPLFLQQIAEERETYFHDHAASAAAWRDLLTRALGNEVYAPRATEVRARLGLASTLTAANQIDQAIEQLQIVVNLHPTAPPGARARAEKDLRAALARTPRK